MCMPQLVFISDLLLPLIKQRSRVLHTTPVRQRSRSIRFEDKAMRALIQRPGGLPTCPSAIDPRNLAEENNCNEGMERPRASRGRYSEVDSD